MKRVAVFGGAGFIGTNLAYRLIEENRQVYNFDNLSGSGNLLNIADLVQKPHHIFARCDVSHADEVRQALLTAAVDTIFVTIAPRNKSVEDALEGLKTFLDSLTLWRNRFVRNPENAQKIIFLTTRTCKNGFSEKAVQMIDDYASQGLPIITLSVPSVFGPFQQPDSSTPFMIYRAIEGESIPVVPEALIDDPLVSVDDVVSALLYIEENGKLGKHYRLLPPASQLSQLEIANTICDVLNAEVPPPMGKYQALIDELDNPAIQNGISNSWENELIPLQIENPKEIKAALNDTVKWYLKHPAWYSQSRTRFFDLWQDSNNIFNFSGLKKVS